MLIIDQFYDCKKISALDRDKGQTFVWIHSDVGADPIFVKKIYDHLTNISKPYDYANFRPVHVGYKEHWCREKDEAGEVIGYSWHDIILKAFKIHEHFPDDLHILIGQSGIKVGYASDPSNDLIAQSPIHPKQCKFFRELTGFKIMVMSTEFFPKSRFRPLRYKRAKKTVQAFVETQKQKVDWFDAMEETFLARLRNRKEEKYANYL